MTIKAQVEQDATHECPAPGCERRIPFERFCCSRHWRTIPEATRNRLWREYRRHFGEERYFAARAECLLALGVTRSEIAAANAGQGATSSASSSPLSQPQPTTNPATPQCPNPYHAPTPSSER